MKEQKTIEPAFVNAHGQLMANVCDIVYGVQWHEYETLMTDYYWLRCPIWHYERYN